MTKSKRKILIIIVLAVTLLMGSIFAYYAHETHTRLRDEQIALKNTEMVLCVFEIPEKDIASAVTGISTQEDDTAEGDNEEEIDLTPFLELIATFNAVREQIGNDDIVAYIYIHGTNVNYVVLQGTDNSFYLSHDMFGNHNLAGSIFLDYLNSPDFTDPNTIIYGHNMGNGTKFHNLRYYVFGEGQQSFFEEHSHIIIITDSEVLVYEIFSVFTTHIDFYYIQVDFADGEFAKLVDELNRLSMHDTGIAATAESNLLLLSTCTNVDRDTRIVIASRLAQRVMVPQLDNDGYD